MLRTGKLLCASALVAAAAIGDGCSKHASELGVDGTAPLAPSETGVTVSMNPPGVPDTVVGTVGAVEADAAVAAYADAQLTIGIGAVFAASDGSFAAINIGDNILATVYVVAIDAAGNISAALTLTNDIVPPSTTLDAAPADATTATTASFTFAASEPSATFVCALDTGPEAPCASPVTYDGLADGSHTFDVHAVDAAGNAEGTPVHVGWIIDTTAPETSFMATPPVRAASSTATFAMAVDDSSATMMCRLDGGEWSVCTSPKVYVGLTDGSHSVEIRGVDSLGNTDPTPVSYTWHIAQWRSVASGVNHTCGVKLDGRLYCWGGNSHWKLGNGSALPSVASVPTQVGTDNDWRRVEVGAEFSCAIKSDGRLFCWGSNEYGQIGHGGDTNDVVPTPVAVGADNVWIDINAGDFHMCGLTDQHSIFCWGDNAFGHVGDGTQTNRNVPTRLGTDTDWATVEAGHWHTCGLKLDGRLFCWGDGQYGQLGNNSTSVHTSPIQVNSDNDWLTLNAGNDHTCAIKSDGRLFCWGANYVGQIGDGTTVNKPVPTQIGTSTTWAIADAGPYHTCASMIDNRLFCWGDNSRDQLGDVAADGNVLLPQQVGIESDWQQISAGDRHTCATTHTGDLMCWGSYASGQLGDGHDANKLVPSRVGSESNWHSVTAGWSDTCANTHDDGIFCWGDNGSGRLGNGTTAEYRLPSQVDANSSWRSISVGGGHTCATQPDGKLYCWGNNSYGQVGATTVGSDQTTPIQEKTHTTWLSVDGGYGHSCAIAANQSMYCWGLNASGQLGNASIIGYTEDPTRESANKLWAHVASGTAHTCGIDTSDKLFCWGLNSKGQLGDDTTTSRNAPTQVPTNSTWLSTYANTWRSVDVAETHTCAINSDNILFCWGDNGSGQLGDGTTTSQSTPQRVGTRSDWQSVSVGIAHTCALNNANALYCWGANRHGQLGDNTTTTRGTPAQEASQSAWQSVSAGYYHTCAIKKNDALDYGDLYCWGEGGAGELGGGNASRSLSESVIEPEAL